jgi:phosphoadenosine phosphosulfate reductase
MQHNMDTNKDLAKKIESAIRILRLAAMEAESHNQPVEIAYSGGKDSDVLLQLAKESGIKVRAIYKNTTIDPPGTMAHVRAMDVEVVQPKLSFFKLIEKKGYPSMFRRFCCEKMKEYKILDVLAVGVRADESPKRKRNYKTFEKCRVYNQHSKVHQYAPIYDWSLMDVIQFVNSRNLTLAPHYLINGSYDFSRRLGCLGCPLKSDRGISDFIAHPAILRGYLRSGVKFAEKHSLKTFKGNAYDAFVCNVFCRSKEEYNLLVAPNLFGTRFDCKKFLEDYFNVKLP